LDWLEGKVRASIHKVQVIHQPGIKLAVDVEIEYDAPQASNPS